MSKKKAANVPYKFENLNTADILTDERYQRTINEARIGRIVKKFDPRLMNPPKVSFRDGKYYVFDGQHTIAAFKIHNGGDAVILCKVYYGLTFEDEARLFVQQNGESGAVRACDKLRALYNSGDADVCEMVKYANDAGFKIQWHGGSPGKNCIVAVSALYSAYKKLGALTFSIMLHDMAAIWEGDADSMRGEIVKGMTRFYSVYAGAFDNAYLIKALRTVSPNAIIRDGKASVMNVSGGAPYARAILKQYNRRRRVKLEDKL